ncbi:MAG: ABC transporter ATP-binding protein [Planctomycetes bacterium]|nr:ABC transporter ATP-binding protein [Planctomycetota bacterium]
MIELRLEEIGKSYAPGAAALADVSLTVAPGECLAIVGPSGCGKTTLLRVIAGLETPSAGRIFLDGRCVNEVPSHQRDIAMLFQRPALIPQQTVRQNLRWAWTLQAPLRLFRSDHLHDEELTRVARLLDLESILDRPISQLSGGQQQRVALGRCLLRQAKLLLLDEPLGHLDAPLRSDLRRQIRLLVKERGITGLHVTHDPEEAFSVGDRVAVIQAGRLVQIDAPARIRRAPANRFVAELSHHQTGGVNVLEGVVTRHDMDTFFETALGRWPMSVQIVAQLRESLCQGENFHAGEGKVAIIIGVAVEDVRCSTAPDAAPDDIRVMLPVLDVESGDDSNSVVAGDSWRRWIGRAPLDERFDKGQSVTMTFSLGRAYWFDHTTGRTLAAPAG